VDAAVRSIPSTWLDGDEKALEQLLDRLLHRRSRLTDLIEACKEERSEPFPRWRSQKK
jgi:hypothetical protein